MKKKIISVIALLAAFLSMCATTAVYANSEFDDLAGINAVALLSSDGVYGHCKNSTGECLAVCQVCGAKYYAPGQSGGSFSMSGVCVLCNHPF